MGCKGSVFAGKDNARRDKDYIKAGLESVKDRDLLIVLITKHLQKALTECQFGLNGILFVHCPLPIINKPCQ